MRRILIPSLLLALLMAPAALAQGTDERWELAPRLVVLNAGGKPANDILGGGVAVRYRVDDRWLAGFAVESLSGDVERPYEDVGLSSPEEIDSTMDVLGLSGWIEREHGAPARRLRWFWTAGLGFWSVDVSDVTGPTVGGGRFDITTDAGTEILASVGGGLRCRLGRRWGFEVGVQADQHFTEWKLTDRVSGRTGTFDDYTTYGLRLGVSYRF